MTNQNNEQQQQQRSHSNNYGETAAAAATNYVGQNTFFCKACHAKKGGEPSSWQK